MVSVVTLPPAVLPILSSLTHTPLSNLCGCVCVRSQMGVAPSVLSESTLNLCFVFLGICVFIKSVWWSTIVCRLCLCVCVLDHKGHLVVRWLLPDSVFCLFVCVHGFFITSSHKLSQPSLRAHPGSRSFPTSHHAHPHSAQFTLLLPLDLIGLMLGWGNAQQRICIFNFRPWRFFHLSINAARLLCVCV